MLAAYLIPLTRAVVFLAFVYATVVAAAHWAVRNGHLQPFSPLARFARQLGAPFVKRLEFRLLRSGGNPVNAPYVMLGIALFGGLVLLALVQWVVGMLWSLGASFAAGPRGILYFAISTTFSVLMIALLVRVIASWFGVSPYSGPMRVIYLLTEWILEPLRRVIPPLGMIDITPFVAYLILMLLRGWLVGMV